MCVLAFVFVFEFVLDDEVDRAVHHIYGLHWRLITYSYARKCTLSYTVQICGLNFTHSDTVADVE